MSKLTPTFDWPKTKWLIAVFLSFAAILASCGKESAAKAGETATVAPAEVSVVQAARRSFARDLNISSELVPFQEIEIYAKESGYVKQILVDYGSHVHKGQLLAILEIPELEATIQQDRSAIAGLVDQVKSAEHQLERVQAQHKVMHLEFERMNSVAQSKPGLVAQQEVDDVHGRDLAEEAQIEGAKANVEVARSNWIAAKARLDHDQALYSYSRITAPFDGVVTQRYANLGTLLQAGTSSSTQALPLVKLSKEDLYRLVIPVPEAYVGGIKVGDTVAVHVPALNQSFPGKVARLSFDVHQDTRTMHSEVDVPNPKGTLLPGMYAEVGLTLNRDLQALAVPVESVDREGDKASVYIVDGSGKIEARSVQLGVETPHYVEVVSGLHEGEQIVVSDRSALTPGEQVHARLTAQPAAKATQS